ncbi:2296_t:CDS:2, partial [Gigaspora margarita]
NKEFTNYVYYYKEPFSHKEKFIHEEMLSTEVEVISVLIEFKEIMDFIDYVNLSPYGKGHGFKQQCVRVLETLLQKLGIKVFTQGHCAKGSIRNIKRDNFAFGVLVGLPCTRFLPEALREAAKSDVGIVCTTINNMCDDFLSFLVNR